MVHGAHKSGSFRKTQVRTATGTKTRYSRKKPQKPHCSCGRPLPGTARGNKTAVGRLSKTQKRPSRPYGGQLCAVCTKHVLRAKAQLSSE